VIKTKPKQNNKCWWGCREIETCVLLVEIQKGSVAMENSMVVPQNIKNRTTIQSNNSMSWYIPERMRYLYTMSS
jgi:hypothetical protein